MPSEEEYEELEDIKEETQEVEGDETLTREEKLQRDYDDRVQESERLRGMLSDKDEELKRVYADLDIYKDRIEKLKNATPIEKQVQHKDSDLESLEKNFYK